MNINSFLQMSLFEPLTVGAFSFLFFLLADLLLPNQTQWTLCVQLASPPSSLHPSISSFFLFLLQEDPRSNTRAALFASNSHSHTNLSSNEAFRTHTHAHSFALGLGRTQRKKIRTFAPNSPPPAHRSFGGEQRASIDKNTPNSQKFVYVSRLFHPPSPLVFSLNVWFGSVRPFAKMLNIFANQTPACAKFVSECVRYE